MMWSKCAVFHIQYSSVYTLNMHSHVPHYPSLQRGEYVSVIIFNLTEEDVQVNSVVLSGYRVA